MGDQAPYESGDFKAKIPLEPIPLFEITNYSKLKQKYPQTDQDIIPFCDRWIIHVKDILEAMCSDLIASMSS
jgi:hypothetical protein